MKTIKSIIAIVAVAISSVFGLSSCEKDNDALNTPRQPKIEVHTETFSNGSNTDMENMAKLTIKDLVGTYKYTAEDGKEWMIVLTENACSAEGHYSASITVPEGCPVAAKTYEGEYQIGLYVARFFSNENAENTTNSSVVSFGLTINNDNKQNSTVTLKYNGKIGEKLVFAKQ